MTQLGIDLTGISPEFSGGSFLPVSDDKGWLVVLTHDNGFKQAASGQGYYLELIGVGQDQAVAGQEFTLRLNLQHAKPAAVSAAYSQAAAIQAVTGNPPGRVEDTSVWFNKPFRVVSVKQANSEYTNLADNGIRDVNGNKPGKSGQGAQMAQPAPMAPAMPPQGQGQPSQNWGPPQGQQMAPPQGQAPGPAQNWGPPQGGPMQGQPAGPQGGWPPQNGGGAQGGGWPPNGGPGAPQGGPGAPPNWAQTPGR